MIAHDDAAQALETLDPFALSEGVLRSDGQGAIEEAEAALEHQVQNLRRKAQAIARWFWKVRSEHIEREKERPKEARRFFGLTCRVRERSSLSIEIEWVVVLPGAGHRTAPISRGGARHYSEKLLGKHLVPEMRAAILQAEALFAEIRNQGRTLLLLKRELAKSRGYIARRGGV